MFLEGMLHMKKDKKMNLAQLADWLSENLNCQIRQVGRRLEAVINADVIEAGTFAALFAQVDGSELMVGELLNTFHSPEEAWAALDSGQASTYDLVPFAQWVQDQYWTAKNVTVEVFDL